MTPMCRHIGPDPTRGCEFEQGHEGPHGYKVPYVARSWGLAYVWWDDDGNPAPAPEDSGEWASEDDSSEWCGHSSAQGDGRSWGCELKPGHDGPHMCRPDWDAEWHVWGDDGEPVKPSRQQPTSTPFKALGRRAPLLAREHIHDETFEAKGWEWADDPSELATMTHDEDREIVVIDGHEYEVIAERDVRPGEKYIGQGVGEANVLQRPLDDDDCDWDFEGKPRKILEEI